MVHIGELIDDDYIVDFSKSHSTPAARSFSDAKEAFRMAIMKHLGFAPKEVVGDGKFHRFATSTRGRDDAGYYRYYDDEFPAGFYGDWRTDAKFKWHSREVSEMSPAERGHLEKVKSERARVAEAERAKAIATARARWENAAPAKADHRYLLKKGVAPHGIRQSGSRLLVPVKIDGEIASLQFIDTSGGKKFVYGAPVAGGYFVLGELGDQFVIGEGFATCATLHEAVGLPVIVAFNAGNLLPVTKQMREKYPLATIVIAADDDHKTEMERGSNPGVHAAQEAAEAVGATVAVPPFDRAIDGDAPSDWNDFAALRGIDAIKEAFQPGGGEDAGPENVEEFRNWLVNQTRDDAGFPFQPAIFDRLRAIYGEDPGQWEQIAKALKDAKISIKSRLEARFKESIKQSRQRERKKHLHHSARPRKDGGEGEKLPGSWGQFALKDSGLYTEIQRGSGESAYMDEVWVSAPFQIVGMTRDPASSGWGKLLRWTDGKGRLHTVIVSDSEAHGDPGPLASRLASQGLRINRNAQRLLATFITGTSVVDDVVLVDRTGWHDIDGHHVFVLPKGAIAPDGAPKVALNAASAAGYASAGSLKDWQNSVGRLAADQSMMRLAISAALAGPLLKAARISGAGIHYHGPSSKGKTTLLRATASVWGPGTESGRFIRQWRATSNGLEGAAAAATDTALILDELGVVDGKEFSSAVYSLANGSGKQRADRMGETREPKSWRVFTISTGEVGVATKANEDGRRKAMAGQSVRLLDINAIKSDSLGVFDSAGDYGSAAELVKAINEATATDYGTAGPAFVRRLIDENVKDDEISNFVRRFTKENVPSGADGQVDRAAQIFGLIATAGEIAIGLGVLPWAPGSVEAAAAGAFSDWLGRRGGVDSAEEQEAVAHVRKFIEMHGESRFEEIGEETGEDSDFAKYSEHVRGDYSHSDDRGDSGDIETDKRKLPVRDRLGWRRIRDGRPEWLFAEETWKVEVCKGLDPVRVAKTLDARGMLRKDSDGRLKCRVTLKDGLRPRVYVVTGQIMEGDDQ